VEAISESESGKPQDLAPNTAKSIGSGNGKEATQIPTKLLSQMLNEFDKQTFQTPKRYVLSKYTRYI
jgi:hypothetical protein